MVGQAFGMFGFQPSLLLRAGPPKEDGQRRQYAKGETRLNFADQAIRRRWSKQAWRAARFSPAARSITDQPLRILSM